MPSNGRWDLIWRLKVNALEASMGLRVGFFLFVCLDSCAAHLQGTSFLRNV